MSPKIFAFVGCRLLAIYVLLSVVQAQISNLFFYLQSLDISEHLRVVQNFDFDPFFQSALLNLGIFFVLWFRAGWFAEKVAAGTPETKADEPATWSRQSAISIVVIASGLWILVLVIPSLTFVLQHFLQRGLVDFISLSYIAAAIAVALTCIFSPWGIANIIAKQRRW